MTAQRLLICQVLLVCPLAFFLLSSCSETAGLKAGKTYNFEGIAIATGDFIFLDGPRGRVSCPRPNSNLLTFAVKHNFDSLLPQILEILRADLQADDAFSRIVLMLPNQEKDLPILDYRLCVNYANGQLDDSTHQRFIALANAHLLDKKSAAYPAIFSPKSVTSLLGDQQRSHKSLDIAIFKGTTSSLQNVMTLTGFVRRSKTLLAANGVYPHFEFEPKLADLKNDEERESAVRTLFKKFRKEKPDYIVTIGTYASEFANRYYRNSIPIIYIGVTDPIKSGLVNLESGVSPDVDRGEVAGTTYGIPLEEWMNLIFAGFHEKRIGYVYQKENYPADEIVKEKLLKAAGGRSPRPQVVPLAVQPSDNNLNDEQLRQADVFFGWSYLDDSFAELASRTNKPFIAGTEHLAAIAPITFWADNFRIGEIAAEDILFQHIVVGIKLSDLPIVTPSVMKIVVNRKVARRLEFEVPNSILNRADLVID